MKLLNFYFKLISFLIILLLFQNCNQRNPTYNDNEESIIETLEKNESLDTQIIFNNYIVNISNGSDVKLLYKDDLAYTMEVIDSLISYPSIINGWEWDRISASYKLADITFYNYFDSISFKLENNLSKDHYGNSLAKITNLIYEYEYENKFAERKILISKPYTSKDNNIFFIMENRIKNLNIDYFDGEGYDNSELKFIKFNKQNYTLNEYIFYDLKYKNENSFIRSDFLEFNFQDIYKRESKFFKDIQLESIINKPLNYKILNDSIIEVSMLEDFSLYRIYYKITDKGPLRRINTNRLYDFTKLIYLNENYFKGFYKMIVEEEFPTYSKVNLFKYLSIDDLDIMRNEIFADHGYIFKTKKWNEYFSSKTWYKPLYNNVDDKLTEIDKFNINLILNFKNKVLRNPEKFNKKIYWEEWTFHVG